MKSGQAVDDTANSFIPSEAWNGCLGATFSAAMLENRQYQQDPANLDDEMFPGNLRK